MNPREAHYPFSLGVLCASARKIFVRAEAAKSAESFESRLAAGVVR
ncbi:hypothetical protein OOT33_13140 [Sphingobium sp. DEHP117]|nr:hypothetical protein [Sphingobium sp. DEHP117]MDQ4421368.1 hypothetical protein [Sphingobium sp. DEHP117]